VVVKARGRKARKNVAEKRRSVLLTTAEQTKLEAQEAIEENHLIVDPSQALAATKIQSVARGRQARKTVQNLRNGSTNAAEEEVIESKEEEAVAVDESVSKTEPSSESTENKNDDKDTHHAATKIQSVARGRQARKRVTNLRGTGNTAEGETAVESNEITNTNEDEINSSSNDTTNNQDGQEEIPNDDNNGEVTVQPNEDSSAVVPPSEEGQESKTE
jgi:hypothetical protein